MSQALALSESSFGLPGFPLLQPASLGARYRTDEETTASLPTETAANPDNDDSLIAVFETHYEEILNFLYRQTGNRTTAEDLTSHTFLKALEQHRRGRLPERIRPWLYRVAINASRSSQRRWARFLSRIPLLAHNEEDNLKSAFETLTIDQESVQARREMDRLPDRYRLPLQLRYDEDLTVAEIADVMGLAPATIRSRIFRGLQKLRGLLNNSSGEMVEKRGSQ
jgi:RNA polymerase sigma-70 factor (ECF subfamily)